MGWQDAPEADTQAPAPAWQGAPEALAADDKPIWQHVTDALQSYVKDVSDVGGEVIGGFKRDLTTPLETAPSDLPQGGETDHVAALAPLMRGLDLTNDVVRLMFSPIEALLRPTYGRAVEQASGGRIERGEAAQLATVIPQILTGTEGARLLRPLAGLNEAPKPIPRGLEPSTLWPEAASAAEGGAETAPLALPKPQPEAFSDAAVAVGGLDHEAKVAPKLEQIHDDTGVPPDQVVAEAQKDVTITQDLLSDNRDVPEIFARGTVTPDKPLFDMTADELRATLDEKQTSDADKLVQALGEQGAKEFNRLDRARNSIDPARADSASAEFEEKFGDLAPWQERLVYGVGEHGASAEDIKAMLDARYDLSDAPTEEVARVLTRGMLDVNPEELRTFWQTGEGRPRVQAAAARIQTALNELAARGATKEEIDEATHTAMANRSYSIDDADEMLSAFRNKEETENTPTSEQAHIETSRSAQSATKQISETVIEQPQPAEGAAPVNVSSKNVPGEPPIIRFRQDASAIEESLPPVPEGFTRLWRGNRPGEKGKATSFTNDLPGIALPFRESYGGDLSYVDIPTSDLAKYENKGAVAPGAEFSLTDDLAAKAESVVVSTEGKDSTDTKRTVAASGELIPAEGAGGSEPPLPPDEGGAGPSPEEQPRLTGPSEPGSIEDARQKIADQISIGGKDPAGKWSWSRLYTLTMDALFPLHRAGEDPYVGARLMAGNAGRVENILNHGMVDFNTLQKVGPGLREVLQGAGEDLGGFRIYLAARRAVELAGRGIESGMDIDAARTVLAHDGARFSHTAAALDTYQAGLLNYLRDAGVLSQESYAAMQDANKHYVPFYRVMEKNKGRAAGGSLTPANPVKKIKGSERVVVDPLESIIKNTNLYVTMAERNSVALKIIDALEPVSEAALIEREGAPASGARRIENRQPQLTGPDIVSDTLAEHGVAPSEDLTALLRTTGEHPGGDEITVFRDGKRETYKVDPEIAAAIKGLDRESTNFLVRVLSQPAKLLRAGATLTPDFMVRNLIRDFFTAMVNTTTGVFTPVNSAKGLVSTLKKDETFQQWLSSGGANAAMVSVDRRYLQTNLEDLTRETGLGVRAWNVVRHPIDALRVVSELTENATRVGAFKKHLDAIKAGDIPTKDEMQRAAYVSREATLDFARMGAKMRAANMLVAFLNANLQGTDRMIRAFKDNPVSTTLRVGAGITVPSMLLWFANHDDPRYKELPQWQKDLFWIVPTENHLFRIPKPFETGVVFGSGVERLLDAFYDKNPAAFKDFAESVVGALLPSFLPTVGVPLVEQFANRSSFTGQALVSPEAEKQLPEYQYNAYTTELAKAIGGNIGAFPGIKDAKMESAGSFTGGVARALTSPALIENYIKAWTGNLGLYIWQLTDKALRETGVLPDPPKPASTLADIPFVRAFVVRYPSASAQSIQDFYDSYDKNKMYLDTWNARAKEGDFQAMQKVQDQGGQKMFAQMTDIRTALSEHSATIRNIYKNGSMTPDDKRQLIDTLYYRMIEIAHAGNESLKQIEQTIGAPPAKQGVSP